VVKVIRPIGGAGAALTLQVELFGTARLTAGRRELTIEVVGEPRASDVVAAIAGACPALVGSVIDEDGTGLLESHVLNVNGTAFVDGGRLDIGPGDRLLLFSSQAGG
jgi:molybdopterin converting factor small subunit